MARTRPIPGQRCLFAPDPGDVIASLDMWCDRDLLHLAREVGYELIRRGRPVPVALPVGEAVSAMGVEYSVPSTQF